MTRPASSFASALRLLLLSAALAISLLPAACTAAMEAVDLKWLLIRVDALTAEVVRSEARGVADYVDLDDLHYQATHPDGIRPKPGALHLYYHHKGRTVHTQTVGDPRLVVREGMDPTTGRMNGTAGMMDEGYVAIHVPADATHVTVIRHEPQPEGQGTSSSSSSSKGTTAQGFADEQRSTDRQQQQQQRLVTRRHRLEVPREDSFVRYREKYSAQAAAGSPELRVVQQQGPPSRMKNLVFVSGGFTAAERSSFEAAVNKSVKFLSGDLRPGIAGRELASQPWDRYMPLINVYSVFEASTDSGASFPLSEDKKKGGYPTGVEVKRKNNLGCKYGIEVLRLMSCDIDLMHTLASYAPVTSQKTTVIAIVNQPEVYGGSGTFSGRACSVYNGDRMVNVLLHELGHADADLSDEYDYGVSEKTNLPLLNCAFSLDLPWKYWHTVAEPLGVGNPVAVCSYRNYFKPTADECVMSTEGAYQQCAACSDAAIRGIYRELRDLASPRCPRKEETMIITNKNEAQYLVANEKFYLTAQGDTYDNNGKQRRTDKGRVRFYWKMPDGTQRETVSNYVSINGAQLGVGDWNVTLRVVDESQFVPPRGSDTEPLTALMNFSTLYRIKVVPQTDSFWGTCTVSGLSRGEKDLSKHNDCPLQTFLTPKYCAICDPGAQCNDTYPSFPSEFRSDEAATLSKIEAAVFGIGGAVAAVVFFAVVGGSLVLARYTEKDVQQVIPWPKAVHWLRIGFLVASCLFMVIAVVVVFLGVWNFRGANLYGKGFAIAAVVFAAILFMLSFVGFVAAWYRSRVLMVVNGVLLGVTAIVLVLMSVVILYIGKNVNTPSIQEPLTNWWLDQVKKHPGDICSFQATYECSGFLTSCHNKYNSECPSRCEVTNRNNPNPCYARVTSKLKRFYVPSGTACVVLTCFVFLGCIANWILVYYLRERHKQNKARLLRQPLGEDTGLNRLKTVRALKNLSALETQQLRTEFAKIDRNGDGYVSAQELRVFFRKAFGMQLTERDVQETIRALDVDNDGKLNMREFIEMCRSGTEPVVVQTQQQVVSDPSLRHLDRQECEQLFSEFVEISGSDATSIQALRCIGVDDIRAFYQKMHGVEPPQNQLEKAFQQVERPIGQPVDVYTFIRLFAAPAEAYQSPAGPSAPPIKTVD